MCLFVLPRALRYEADGNSRVGWPEKGSYTVHFAPALISMSSVKTLPMSRSEVDGKGEERGQSQSRLYHQTATKM